MNIIGYWIESLYDDRFLAPQEVSGKLSTDLVDVVSNYLKAGHALFYYGGFSFCRFFCHDSQDVDDWWSSNANGSRELTDGYWVWPEGLIHYVEEHKVDLPKAFLSDVLHGKAQDKSAQSRETIEFQINNNIEIQRSLDVWLEWCRQNQDPTFRKQLLLMREKAEPMAEAALRDKLQKQCTKLNAKYGLSKTNCLQAGCNEYALAGQVFCAIHYGYIPSIEDGRNAIDHSMLRSLLLNFSNCEETFKEFEILD
jgi:hypothetical protein